MKLHKQIGLVQKMRRVLKDSKEFELPDKQLKVINDSFAKMGLSLTFDQITLHHIPQGSHYLAHTPEGKLIPLTSALEAMLIEMVKRGEELINAQKN